MIPNAAAARPTNVRRTRRKAAASAAATSQSRSTSPGTPVSAATVTGVLCDAAAFGSLPFRPARSAYARLKPATPTPTAGWSTAMSTPREISEARPLVASFQPLLVCSSSVWRTCGAENPSASATAAVSAIASERAPAPDERRRDQRPHDQRREARLRVRVEQARAT